jgi:hypothetical protein
MESMQRPQQVERVVCYILEAAQKKSANTTYSSEEILRDYKNIMQKDERVIIIPDNSIVTLISQLAKKSDSNIYCLGKKQGYYFSNASEDFLEESAIDESETTLKEKELYSIFTQWLSFSCDRVSDIANSRSMHKWGNPDIFGVNVFYLLGQPQIEITTLEVKKDMKDWRKNIFEAVAHTLFANKVYFCCVCKESEFEKDRTDMLLYAQQFKIGILTIVIDDDVKQPSALNVNMIREIIPAPNRTPEISMKKKFIESLNLYNMSDLYHFGKNNSEITDINMVELTSKGCTKSLKANIKNKVTNK